MLGAAPSAVQVDLGAQRRHMGGLRTLDGGKEAGAAHAAIGVPVRNGIARLPANLAALAPTARTV
jgi:hypothetical protein